MFDPPITFRAVTRSAAAWLLTGLTSLALAQEPRAGDWPMYSHDLAGTRFSPLTAINTRNVARLAQAWAVRLDAQVNANPMTYLGKDGEQYVAAVVDDTLIAFALR